MLNGQSCKHRKTAIMAKPKSEFKILIVYPNLPLMLSPSLAVGLFTKILKSNGYNVDLFDTTYYVGEDGSHPQTRAKLLQVRSFNEEEDLGANFKYDLLASFRRHVLDFKPDLMIFSLVEDVLSTALKLLNCVQDLNVPHLIGGVFPTAAPNRCFDFPEINMIGLGEGEQTVLKVAEALRVDHPLENIPGVWFRDSVGEIHKNPHPPLINISEYCPDYSLFEENRFFRPMGGKVFKMVSVETYRGCPYQCTYCNSPMHTANSKKNNLGSFLRRKPMPVLRNELHRITDLHNPEFVLFIDDSFLARPQKEIFEFCDMYEEFRLPFFINSRPECFTPENLRRLKEVGCYRISAAIESGNEDYRTNVLRRKGTNKDLVRWFALLTESGIPYTINLIIGFPGETREMVMNTVELVRSIEGYDTLTVSIFTPYHGTVLRDVAIKNKWLDPNLMVETHFTATSILQMPPPYLNSEEINGLIRTIPLYCYFPKSEFDHIKRAEINDATGNELLEQYADIYRRDFLGESQEEKKTIKIEGGSGCRSNPKDSFQITEKKLTTEEIQMLTLNH